MTRIGTGAPGATSGPSGGAPGWPPHSLPDNKLDDEIMDAFMEASINAITPKEYTERIRQLIAEARIEELEKVGYIPSQELLVSGDKPIADRIAELNKLKEQR